MEPIPKRTFIAIDAGMPEPLAGALGECRKELAGERIRWVRNGQVHLTLKFLGDTSADLIPEITGGVRTTAGRHWEFDLALEGLGVFRSLQHPRVLWAGIRQNGSLMGLQAGIEERLKSYGFPERTDSFSPHLTLGRMKRITDLRRLKQLIDRMAGVNLGVIRVREVIYFESILGKSGAKYRIIARLPLG